ncbi:unnamed protein product, partial [Chrysoparadoxa australica]
ERAVLKSFFKAPNGQQWDINDGWQTERPLSEWHGVTVDEKGHVTILNLRTENLEGSIPAELGQLNSLQVLNLCYNKLSGSIPAELGQLSSLKVLDLSENQLSGE